MLSISFRLWSGFYGTTLYVVQKRSISTAVWLLINRSIHKMLTYICDATALNGMKLVNGNIFMHKTII